MKLMKYPPCLLVALLSVGCYFSQRMTSSQMNRLELGMTKEQITEVLGSKYTIAEKRTEGGSVKETLSYRNLYHNEEVYLFLLVDGRLESWHRQLLPKYEIIKPQVMIE